MVKLFWKKSNTNSSTISCFSRPTVTVTLKHVTEIVIFILKILRWMKMEIHITLRIIKIFTVSVALNLRVYEVSRYKRKFVNTSKNKQSC
jgi:hypothetical protein